MTSRTDFAAPIDETLQRRILLMVGGHCFKLNERLSVARVEPCPDVVELSEESGVEIEEKPKREGFGMELLRRSLPYDLQAETKVELKRQGLEVHLDMPLREPPNVG